MVILISAGCILALLLASAILAFRVPITSDYAKKIAADVVETAVEATVTVLRFPKSALQKYAERMATTQPISNDRLLDGEGKNHTLSAVASVASSSSSSVISVLTQIGDTFS